MQDTFPTSRTGVQPWRETTIFWACVALVFAPLLFLSTEPYVAWLRLAAFASATIIGGKWFVQFWDSSSRPHQLIFVGILAAHIASSVGGLFSDIHLTRILWDGIAGTIAIGGIFIATRVFLSENRRATILRLLAILLGLLALSSLVGYFFPLHQLIPIGENSIYFEPTRLQLFWPTRLLTEFFGQLAWEHANHAGFLFSIGLILGLESIARFPSRKLLWFFPVIMGLCVFLTGSRSSWLAILGCLPFVVLWRSPKFLLTVLGLLGISILLGLAGLKLKQGLLASTSKEAKPNAPPIHSSTIDLHTSGLIERGSSGRLAYYPILWSELENHRAFGRGLASTGKPVGQLNHEHSIFLGSLRGGGFIALSAHLLILGFSAWFALQLFRKGIRWPLLLLVGTITNCLFDRGNIFKLGGGYGFILHWIAIFIPMHLASRKPGALQDAN